MSSEYTAPRFNDQAFWTGNTSTEAVAYDFHPTSPSPDSGLGIEAEFEPHAPIIHAIDEPELSDDELDEYEARIAREERMSAPAPLEIVRRHLSNALRSAQTSDDLESADAISRDLLAALSSLDQLKGGSANV